MALGSRRQTVQATPFRRFVRTPDGFRSAKITCSILCMNWKTKPSRLYNLECGSIIRGFRDPLGDNVRDFETIKAPQ